MKLITVRNWHCKSHKHGQGLFIKIIWLPRQLNLYWRLKKYGDREKESIIYASGVKAPWHVTHENIYTFIKLHTCMHAVVYSNICNIYMQINI